MVNDRSQNIAPHCQQRQSAPLFQWPISLCAGSTQIRIQLGNKIFRVGHFAHAAWQNMMRQPDSAACQQVAEGEGLHDGHRSQKEMVVAVIYHGYTDA